MIYNVTKLFTEYDMNSIKAFLNVGKVQILYLDTLSAFILKIKEPHSESKKRLVLDIVKRKMSTIPIAQLTNCPKCQFN